VVRPCVGSERGDGEIEHEAEHDDDDRRAGELYADQPLNELERVAVGFFLLSLRQTLIHPSLDELGSRVHFKSRDLVHAPIFFLRTLGVKRPPQRVRNVRAHH
jgi:hypothetical protein